MSTPLPEVKQTSNPSSLPASQPIPKRRLSCLVRHGAELEDFPSRSLRNSSPEEYDKQYYQVNARNALRYLTYGQPFFKKPYLSASNLRSIWLNFRSLFVKRDKQHLDALRDEFKNIFENAYDILRNCDPDTEARLEIFLNTLISNFPYLDPENGEPIFIPKKIAGQWQLVPYTFTRIDISPRSGWLSKLIEAEDRIYAWGLEPRVSEANPYLLIMGTTYLSGQGSYFSLLGDLSAGKSVGEIHDLTHLERWVKQHDNIIISGHSQGGSMAMIIAGLFPDHVRQAFALNPAALLKSTIEELKRTWNARRNNTQIHVYTQEKDPVFIFGEDFLPGTRFFHITHPHSKLASLFAAHANHSLGRSEANYEEIHDLHQRNANSRKFWNEVKTAADNIFGPLVMVNFAYRIIKRKVLRFYQQHREALRIALFLILLAASIAMIASGILTIPGLITLGSMVNIGTLALGAVAISAIGTALLPSLIKYATYGLELIIGGAIAMVAGVSLALSAAVAGIRAGLRTLKKDTTQVVAPESQNQSTHLSLSHHLAKHCRASSVLPLSGEVLDSRSNEENKQEAGNGRAHTIFPQPPKSPVHAQPQPAQHQSQHGSPKEARKN